MVGIVSYGVYIPRLRLRNREIADVWGEGVRSGERAVPDHDEDPITMAVEATDNALKRWGGKAESLDALYLATDTGPYRGKPNSTILASELGVRPEAVVADVQGGSKAGTHALLSCIDLITSGRGKIGLVVASDGILDPKTTHVDYVKGAGASAFILGTEGTVADVEASYSYTTDFLDVWSLAKEGTFRDTGDPRFARDQGYLAHVIPAAKGLMKKLGRTGDAYNHIAIHEPSPELSKTASKQLGAKPETMKMGALTSRIGETGASLALLGLASFLDEAHPNEKMLLVSYSPSYGSDALSIIAKEGVERGRGSTPTVEAFLERAVQIDYPRYLRLTGILEREERGVSYLPVFPIYWRMGPSIYRLEAGRCRGCGAVNFPKREICIECGSAGQFDPTHLGRRGKVVTYAVQYYVPPEFESPMTVAVVELEGGGRFSSIMTECRPEEMKIGMTVELVFRRIREEHGVVSYYYKLRPVREGG